MPGSLVRDSLSPQLFAGATLNAAGSTNGTAVQVDKPGDVMVEIVTGTVTGTTPTLLVTIQGADDSGFTTNVVNICEFPVTSGTGAAQSSKTKRQNTYIGKQFVRAAVTLGGTSPVYTGSTCKIHIERDRVTPATDTA